MTLSVLVPKPGSAAAALIDPGSGVVTAAGVGGDMLLVYFEGNRYRAENINTFADKVAVAADRLLANYPTIARGVFRRSDFQVVGVMSEDGELDLYAADVIAKWEGR